MQKSKYIAIITSWENDADHINNVSVFDIESQEDVQILLDFCAFFVDGSNWSEKEEIIQGAKANKYLEKHKKTLCNMFGFTYDPELSLEYSDITYELGLGGGEHYFARTYDGAKVLLVPGATEDVTKHFIT